MGRDGIMPRKVFGHVSVRFATPTFAILFVSVVSLLAIWITLTFLASIVSFGALVAFSVVNLAVIKHYFVDKGEKKVFNNLILPAVGFILTAWLWTSLSWTTLVYGSIWLAIGFIWLLVVTRGFQRPTPVLDMKE
jgi:putrescine importer